jgi:hypothetical protein
MGIDPVDNPSVPVVLTVSAAMLRVSALRSASK